MSSSHPAKIFQERGWRVGNLEARRRAKVRGMDVRGMKIWWGQFSSPIPLTSIPLTSPLVASISCGPECRAPSVAALPRYGLALRLALGDRPSDSGQHAFYHLAGNIGQAKATALELEGQSFVIHVQQMQWRGDA